MIKTHIDIGLLKHARVQLAAVYGLTDIFLTANRIARDELNLDKPEFCISHWDASGSGSDPNCLIATPTNHRTNFRSSSFLGSWKAKTAGMHPKHA